MTFKGLRRALWLAGAALPTGILLAPPAAAEAEPALDYDLPAQDLGETLKAIARISGREVLYPADIVRGLKAPQVRGRLTADAAIQRALSQSPLVAETRAGAVLIRPRGTAADDTSPALAVDKSITITGTRIRGAGSTSPVIVTTRRSLEQAGVTDLASFARILPQNYTGGQNPGVAGGGEQGGQENINNSATLNLRGLGPDATLTLLDGHRIAYDALNQGIDIAAIPLSAVDRIEVITDGASALYGSDAVGGVANIILRRDYDGLETSARVGASTQGGDVQHEYSAVAGHRWSSGGFMLALDDSTASPIYANQRSYTRDLDPSLTLTLRNAQLSAVIAGHQELAPGLSFELDGFAMDRRSLKQIPFTATDSVLENGLVSHPQLRSFALTPTFRLDVGKWQASLSATRGVSRTQLLTSDYFDGVPLNSRLTYENRLSGVEGTAEGPLFALPGGDARLAFGGGLRKLALHDNIVDVYPDHIVPYRDFTERRTVEFGYGELSLPIAGPDLHWPFVERLTLSAALRYERWKGIDAVATPKLGFVYEPAGGLKLSGTWGKSFKVPTLEQVHEAPAGYLIPGYFFTQPQPPLGDNATVILIGGGNPNLKAEHATTWSGTLELRPRIVPGLHLQASYFNVDYRNRITSPVTGTLSALANPLFSDFVILSPTVDQVNGLIATFPQGLVNETGAPFDPTTVGAIIDSSLRNTARQRIQGIDLTADYSVDAGPGEHLLLSGSASYLDSRQQLTPSQSDFALAGTIFNPPHWRGRVGAQWEGPSAGLSAFVNYVGSTLDNRLPNVVPVGAFVTLDVSASYQTRAPAGPLSGIELRLSALNLLNEQPDVIRNDLPEAPSYNSTNQSPVGRFVSLSIRKVW